MRKWWIIQRSTFEIESNWNDSGETALEFRIGGGAGEDVFLFHFAIPFLVIVFISLRGWSLAKRLHLPHDGRNTGFYYRPEHKHYLHVEIWQRQHEWKQGDWSWGWFLTSDKRNNQ